MRGTSHRGLPIRTDFWVGEGGVYGLRRRMRDLGTCRLSLAAIWLLSAIWAALLGHHEGAPFVG
jgi:hypothetical protein